MKVVTVSDPVVASKMEHYSQVSNELKTCEKKIEDMKSSMKVMESYISSKDREKIGSIISCNQERVFELKSELNMIGDEIERLQSGCEHTWVNTGHDSHYDYYRCSKCGFEDRW